MKPKQWRLNYSLILGILLGISAHPLQAKKTSGVYNYSSCATKLRHALVGGKRISVADRSQALRWHAQEQSRISAELQVAWSHVSTEGLKENEYYFWLREEGLRNVNTIANGIAFTERYLLLKDWHLTQMFREHPEWGRLVHRNFKDRAIVTSLDPAELKRIIDSELQRRLLPDLLDMSPMAASYYGLLMGNTRLGASKTFEGAHIKASGFDINTWHKQSTEVRTRLEAALGPQLGTNKSTTELLVQIYKRKKNNNSMLSNDDVVTILAKNKIFCKVSDPLVNDIQSYLQLLQGADLLPPPDVLTPAQVETVEAWLKTGRNVTPEIATIVSRRPWTQRYATFFQAAFDGKAKHMLGLDIKGFSEQAFAVRDTWIMTGEQRQNLRKIYVESTKYLNEFFDGLQAEIWQQFHVKVLANFRSGDDALFAFGPEVTDAQMAQITSYLRANKKNLYASPATRQNTKESLNMLIEAVRVGISELKEK